MSADVLSFPADRSAGARRRRTKPVAPDRDLLRRGIFRAPYTKGGRAVLIAVDSAGDLVAEVVLTDGRPGNLACADALEALLDAVDRIAPPAPLTLERTSGGTVGGTARRRTIAGSCKRPRRKHIQ